MQLIKRDQLYLFFLGEGLVRSFRGSWVRLSTDMIGMEVVDEPVAYGVVYPTSGEGHVDVVSSLLPLARTFNSGKYRASIFSTTEAVLASGA